MIIQMNNNDLYIKIATDQKYCILKYKIYGIVAELDIIVNV